MTAASIVEMVTTPNTAATIATEAILPFAAGYMIRGIRGSQGPKTKIVNRIHGVRLFESDLR